MIKIRYYPILKTSNQHLHWGAPIINFFPVATSSFLSYLVGLAFFLLWTIFHPSSFSIVDWIIFFSGRVDPIYFVCLSSSISLDLLCSWPTISLSCFVYFSRSIDMISKLFTLWKLISGLQICICKLHHIFLLSKNKKSILFIFGLVKGINLD